MSAATVADTLPAAVPASGQPATVRADLTREYAVGGAGLWQAGALRSLPVWIDDVTADFGADLYERILLDARVAAEVDNLKAAILEDGVILTPAVQDEGADGYALAATIRDAAEAMLDDLETPLQDALWDLLGALALGNRVAEQVYGYGDVAGRTGLVLTALRVKPRAATAFVVDAYRRLVGLLARTADSAGTFLPAGLPLDPAAPPPNLLPREKFAVLSNRPVEGDPRGTSILRPVYTPWVAKQEMLREHLKYLTQFATPSLIGTLAQSQRDTTDPDGNLIRAVDAMLTQLLAFKNSTALVVPFGASVKELYSQGEGRAFLLAFAEYNRDITLAISGQTLATTEGEHQARAAAQVHQDTKNTRARQAKLALARVLRRDVLRLWVRANWGDAAIPLAPQVSLGSVEEEDLTPRMTAVAALETAGYLAPSQRPAIDAMLGLPQRTPEETALETERASQPPVQPPPAPGRPPADETQPADEGRGTSESGSGGGA